MKDKDFLEWLRGHLHLVHNEPLDISYMIKLKAIIDRTDEDQLTMVKDWKTATKV